MSIQGHSTLVQGHSDMKIKTSETSGLIALKLGMWYWVSGPIVVHSNDDWLDLDPIYIVHQGQIWSHTLLYGKKWKLLIFWKLLLPVNFNFVFAISLMRK